MPTLENIYLVAISGFVLSLSPGPSMFYVLSRSISINTYGGIASTIGLAIGGIIIATITSIGFSMAITKNEFIYSVILLSGGLYLIYLGFQCFRFHNIENITLDQPGNIRYSKILRQGILVELLNPKTALFLLAFVPQFVDQSSTNLTTQILFLSMLIPLTAIPSDLFVSIMGGSISKLMKRNPAACYALNCLSGLILVGLGIRVFYILFFN